MGFPRGASGKEPACNAGDIRDVGSIPGSERSLEKGMAIHSSILAWKIPWTRGTWWATVHGVVKTQTRLNTHTRHTFTKYSKHS